MIYRTYRGAFNLLTKQQTKTLQINGVKYKYVRAKVNGVVKTYYDWKAAHSVALTSNWTASNDTTGKYWVWDNTNKTCKLSTRSAGTSYIASGIHQKQYKLQGPCTMKFSAYANSSPSQKVTTIFIVWPNGVYEVWSATNVSVTAFFTRAITQDNIDARGGPPTVFVNCGVGAVGSGNPVAQFQINYD